MIIENLTEAELRNLAETIGRFIPGGSVIELVGDLGAGKTTFVKGLAIGLNIDEDIQSPTFTISRSYDISDGRRLAHYDFYRLTDAGILAGELAETVNDPTTITVIEWAAIIDDVLPTDRIRIVIASPTESSRRLTITAPKAILELL